MTDLGNRRFPLTLADEGDRVRIVAVQAGRGMTRRLTDMGLPMGSEIVVVQRLGKGSVVVAHEQTRMALGAGMAHRILVTPADGFAER